MHIVTIILTVILILISVALIIAVLMQPGKSAGLSGAISGGAETFFGKNKAKSYEGKLVLLTKVMTGALFVLALALVIIVRKYGG
jgi:preprotein translocase subunit SecG